MQRVLAISAPAPPAGRTSPDSSICTPAIAASSAAASFTSLYSANTFDVMWAFWLQNRRDTRTQRTQNPDKSMLANTSNTLAGVSPRPKLRGRCGGLLVRSRKHVKRALHAAGHGVRHFGRDSGGSKRRRHFRRKFRPQACGSDAALPLAINKNWGIPSGQ